MKLALASDLHNEFYETPPKLPAVDADILVLAGDIQTVKSHDLKWWEETCEAYKYVLYIRGNHEYYGTYYADYPALEFPDNVIAVGRMPQHINLFENSFLLGTMWTDLSNPFHEMKAKDRMNDYRKIKYSRERWWFNPEDTTREWNSFRESLAMEVPDIVVSHHLPSYGSVDDEEFKNDDLNVAYATEMDTEGVTLWMHGHTHVPCDYEKYGCRIVCNPKGYPGQRSENYKPLVISA